MVVSMRLRARSCLARWGVHISDDTTVYLVRDPVNEAQADAVCDELDLVFATIPEDRPRIQQVPNLEDLPPPRR